MQLVKLHLQVCSVMNTQAVVLQSVLPSDMEELLASTLLQETDYHSFKRNPLIGFLFLY